MKTTDFRPPRTGPAVNTMGCATCMFLVIQGEHEPLKYKSYTCYCSMRPFDGRNRIGYLRQIPDWTDHAVKDDDGLPIVDKWGRAITEREEYDRYIFNFNTMGTCPIHGISAEDGRTVEIRYPYGETAQVKFSDLPAKMREGHKDLEPYPIPEGEPPKPIIEW